MTTPNPVPPRDPQVAAIAAALAEPFEAREVKFKPQMVKNNRCLAMPYIDARLVQDRLDDVLGVENWQDDYRLLPDGSVMCRLKVKLGDRWVRKADVGSPSEQPDTGDRLKAAFSDALKRAAVKFGIGRYLYRLSAQWVDYDPVKKQIVQPPQLPAFALPKGKGAPAAKQAPAPAPKQPVPPPAEQPQPGKWAAAIVASLREAKSREEATPLWNSFDQQVKAGTITPTDRAALDAAFAEFGKRFPKPKQEAAKA